MNNRTPQEQQELDNAAIAEVLRLKKEGKSIRIELGAVEVLYMTGAIQLAMRHPTVVNTEYNAHLRQFLDQAIDKVSKEMSTELAEMLNWGFDESYDVPYTGEEEEPYDPDLDHQDPPELPGPFKDPITMGDYSDWWDADAEEE